MADIFDYLTWRGDLSMDQVPLGPVDALVLTTMCYVQFRDLVPAGPEESVTLEQAARGFLALPKEEREIRVRSRNDEQLLEKLLECPRFSTLRLNGHEDRLEEDCQMQFAALAVHLGKYGTFLAYRGTDNTLVGWKEDFNMTFQDAVPAQWVARDYLERCAGWFEGDLILGGHSKGGNLSVFAASMCCPQVRQRVKAIYNHDGPGFTDLVMNSEGYRQLVSRIHSFVPQSSVVGMLLEHREPYIVVKSRQIGVFQHDPYSWKVLGNDFVCQEDVTEGSRVLDHSLKSWIEGLSVKERGEIVDTVYDLLQTSDADRVQELLQLRNIRSILRAVRQEDEQSLRLVTDSIGRLAKTVVRTVKDMKKEE